MDAERALALQEAATGSEVRSCWNGFACLTLARAFKTQEKPGKALAAYASALEHLRPSLGEKHPETQEAATGVSSPESGS